MLRTLFSLLFSLTLSPHLFGQGGVSLRGRVQETGGAVVTGVKVVLVYGENQERQQTTTTEDGSFVFASLAPGDYILRVDASGFDPYQTTVEVGTDKLPALKITLKLKTVEEDVVVRPDTSDDVLSPQANTDSVRVDEVFFNGLPLDIDYLLPFINTFTSPAAQGTEGTSIVVDDVDGGELDMPTSAVRSVKINRDPYSAEFQHPGGARAEVTTKHGHKHRHEGSLAYYARNSVFDARNAFAAADPNLNRGFVEGSLGGPLPGKNGSFFLAGQRLVQDEDAVIYALNTVDLTGPLNANVPIRDRHDHFFARATWSLTELQSVSLNYTFSNRGDKNQGIDAPLTLPEQGFSVDRHTHRVQLIHSAVLSPRLRNEAILVFKALDSQEGGPASGPEILVNGAFTGGPSQTFNGKEARETDIQDTATYLRGRHSFLFGATIRNDWWRVFDASNFGGTFEFSSLDQYRNVVQNHIGTPDLYQVNQGNPRASFFVEQISGFAQDTAHALPNLSVTFGLRYDWQNTLDNRKDVAPRLAIAFTPSKLKKTVLRAGAGIFYDNLPRSATEDSLLLNGTNMREIDISSPSYPNPFLGGQVTSPPPSITRVSSVSRSPYLFQTSAGVEQEIWKGAWLSAEYSYLRGVHMFRLRDVNAPLPSDNGLRPDPNFSNIEEYESTAFLEGQTLTVTFRGGRGKRFKAYGQYVLSKYTNDVSNPWPGVFSFPADNYNLAGEIGPADFDRRHRINLSGIFQGPYGLQMGSILSAASGAPFDITTGVDPFGDSVTRPPGITRNTGRGPGTVQLDMRLTKAFSLQRASEPGGHRPQSRQRMELSLDAFNAINRTNAMTIVGVETSPLFGQPDSAAPARTLQMSAKYSF